MTGHKLITREVPTDRRLAMVEITDMVRDAVRQAGVAQGMVIVYVPHTTAGVTINENADPDVTRDMIAKLERLFPKDEAFYRHAEGNSDSHLKATLTGLSQTVLVEGGRLVLGTWQGVWFCEFDGPRRRQVKIKVVGFDQPDAPGPA